MGAMALDVNRWLKYAKARLDTAVNQGNASLDRREAEREAELADKPWLRSDRAAPTLDEAKARIEWEAEEQRRRAAEDGAPPATADPGGGSRRPQATAGDAEHESARLELDRREQASAARLEQIRRQLGVEDAPAADEAPEDGKT